MEYLEEISRGVVVNVLDWVITVSEFELQSRNYVYFWNNTLGKGMIPIISHSMN